MPHIRFYFEPTGRENLDKVLMIVNNTIPNQTERYANFNDLAKFFVRTWIIQKNAELANYKMTRMVGNQRVTLNLSPVNGGDLFEEAERTDGLIVEFNIGNIMGDSLRELLPFINETNRLRSAPKFATIIELMRAIVSDNISVILTQDLQARLRSEDVP